MQRLENLSSQLTLNSASSLDSILTKNPDDVVIVAAHRTPIVKARKGGFRNTASAEILARLLEAQIKKVGIDPSVLGDVVVGNVSNPGAGAVEHRAAELVAGIPNTVPFQAVNRQCSSGLMAVNNIATQILAGQIDIGIGAGVESMSNSATDISTFPASFAELKIGSACLIPMGITSENVAKEFHVTRQDQDAFAAESFRKAEQAQKTGLFEEEILPIEALDDNDKMVLISQDEGIRKGVTPQSLSKLRPAFREDGATTAGNASQVSDGAGSVILARRSFALKHGLPIIGKFVHCRTCGVPPEIMGIGPAVAIPAVLKDTGLNLSDVDIFEINEAFASQALYSIRKVGIDMAKVNPKGGAIALGHPLGATGARQVSTLLTELHRTGKKVGVTSMCIGTGMGAASVIIAE